MYASSISIPTFHDIMCALADSAQTTDSTVDGEDDAVLSQEVSGELVRFVFVRNTLASLLAYYPASPIPGWEDLDGQGEVTCSVHPACAVILYCINVHYARNVT